MIPDLFLEDLSLWTVAWQSTLFVVIGLVGSFLLRCRPARASQVLFLTIIAAVLLPTLSVLVRHYELGLFTEKPIVLPSFEIEMPAETPKILPVPEIQPAVLEVPTDLALMDNGSETIRIPWRLIVLYAWMIAALILLGRLIIAFINGIHLLRHTQSDSCEHIKQAADSARARFGITKGLKVCSSKHVRSPMIWCWNRPPVLLVPGDLNDRINWVDVICHELAHWRRWDHVSGLIAELAVCILPWNPLLWWSKKRMVRLSEQACDDWVLAGGYAGTDYAQSLLNLSPELQMAFMPTVIGKEKPMKKRIYRIVKEKCGIPQVGARWALVVTMIAATLTVGVALAQRRPVRFEPRQRDEMIAAERRGDLENRARESRERLADVRAELAELEQSGRAESDRAHALRGELRDLENEMARIEREFSRAERDRPDREMRPIQDRGPRQEILRRLEELGHETEMVLQRLAEQRIGGNEHTDILHRQLQQLNEQMQQVRQQLGLQFEGPGRQRMEFRQEIPDEKLKHMEGLGERARQIEQELYVLSSGSPDRVLWLAKQLHEIRMKIEQNERESDSLREQQTMHQRELREQAQQLEKRLQELGDGHPEESQELRMHLEQLHQQMERIEREPGVPERPWPRLEEPMQPGDEFYRRQLMARREQLRAQIREQELMLKDLLNDRAQAESERTQMLRANLYDLSAQLKGTEKEIRESQPGEERQRGREDLEREVQNLRKQMDGMNEQMSEMRELMKRLLEKSETPEVKQ